MNHQLDLLPAHYTDMTRLQFSKSYLVSKEVMRKDIPNLHKLAQIHLGLKHSMDMYGKHVRSIVEVGCRSSCSSCCHQTVHISSSEAILIALFIEKTKLKTVNLDQAAARIKGLSVDERWTSGIPCPFLRDKNCSIYAARPEPCVSHLSASRSACLTSFARRKKEGDTVPSIVEPKLIGTMLRSGADAAIREAGLIMGMGELEEMVSYAVKPGAIDKWLSGEQIFPENETSEKYRFIIDQIMYVVSDSGALEKARIEVLADLTEQEA